MHLLRRVSYYGLLACATAILFAPTAWAAPDTSPAAPGAPALSDPPSKDAQQPDAATSESKTPNSDIRVTIVRGVEGGCGEVCPEWISLEGDLTKTTEAEFRKLVKTLGSRRLPILIYSSGGDVSVGYAIGRLVRELHLDVAVGRTDLEDCDADEAVCASEKQAGIARGTPHSVGTYCNSACIFILAAGMHRDVAPWSQVAFNQIGVKKTEITRSFIVKTTRTRSNNDEVIVKKKIVGENRSVRSFTDTKPDKDVLAEEQNYLKEMGLSPDLYTLMAANPAENVHWMTQSELESSGLATSFFGAEALLAASLPALESAKTLSNQVPSAKAVSLEPLGPYLPVGSITYAVVQLPWTATQKAKIGLELVHHKFSPVVDLSLVLENRDELNPEGTFAMAVTFGITADAPAFLAQTSTPLLPMVAKIPASVFCKPDFNFTIKLKLAQIEPEQVVSEFGTYAKARHFTDLSPFLSDVCRAPPIVKTATESNSPSTQGNTAPDQQGHEGVTAPPAK